MKNTLLLLILFLVLLGGGFSLGFYFPYGSQQGTASASYNVEPEPVAADATAYDFNKMPKNIIFLIGDGMGVSQIYAGMTANKGALNLERIKHIGFSKTYSANAYITDSAAGATAFSIGKKTFNGAIGMDADSVATKTILEMAEENGLLTGLVSTSSITHATPASFIAHQPSRYMQYEIAQDFLNTDIEVFIGGGQKWFRDREDGLDLTQKLTEKGYQVVYTLEDVNTSTSPKLAGLLDEDGMPKFSEGRGTMLQDASLKAIDILSKADSGFFLMIEGSQIDWGGHANDLQYVIDEMLDFDQVVGKVLDFAAKDGNTLVVITADHETGGLALNGGNLETGDVEASFSSMKHTSVMVPVFAFGPQSHTFQGIYENTEIFNKFLKAYQMKNTQ